MVSTELSITKKTIGETFLDSLVELFLRSPKSDWELLKRTKKGIFIIKPPAAYGIDFKVMWFKIKRDGPSYPETLIVEKFTASEFEKQNSTHETGNIPFQDRFKGKNIQIHQEIPVNSPDFEIFRQEIAQYYSSSQQTTENSNVLSTKFKSTSS